MQTIDRYAGKYGGPLNIERRLQTLKAGPATSNLVQCAGMSEWPRGV